MKTRTASSLFLVLTITAVLALAARNVAAQDSLSGSAAQTASPQLSYGVSEIVQLSKANVSEGTIVSYIQNAGSSYGLDANQIVYLKQQGVSDAVINTMLDQHPQAAPAPQPTYVVSAPATTVVAQPAVTYVQPAPVYVPSSTVYVIPDTQAYRHNTGYYNSYCGYSPCYSPYTCYSGGFPVVSFSVGFGGGYRGGYSHAGWGGGYHGGFHSGYHGGWHH